MNYNTRQLEPKLQVSQASINSLNEVNFVDLTVMMRILYDVRFAIVIILSTSIVQAFVSPKLKFTLWIGNNIWFMIIIILILLPKFAFE